MRLEILVFGITSMIIYNIYTDGKYLKLLFSYKKYYQMGGYIIMGIGLYLMLKKNPSQGRELLYYANNIVKTLPIDKSSLEMLSPIIDFTTMNKQSFMESMNNIEPQYNDVSNSQSYTNKPTKRSVSETKKKFVAASQNWKCGHCNNQLDHTFEIDHKLRLEYGGSNDANNLIALCRNCHGRKTASENM